MSYLLGSLGRGLLGRLQDAFSAQLPHDAGDEPDFLRARMDAAPEAADLSLRLVFSLLSDGRLAEAREAMAAAADRSASPRLLALARACLADELGRFDEAIRALDVAAALDPTDPAIAFGVGFCAERSQRKLDAARAYERALRLCPALRNARERLMALRMLEQDWLAAAGYAAELVQQDPSDVDARLTLAGLLFHSGDAEAALEQFQNAVLVEPGAEESAFAECDVAIAAGQMEAALSAAEDLVERHPGVCEFRLQLADIYSRLERDAPAVEAYEQALELRPDLLEAHIKLGAQHLRGSRFADAARTFNHALDLNERLLLAFCGLALAQQRAERDSEADATLDLASSLCPSSTLLLVEAQRLRLRVACEARGETFDGESLFEESLRRQRQALAQNPADADACFRVGMMLRHAGQSEAAIAALRCAVRIQPAFARAQLHLGLLRREAGELSDAWVSLERVLRVRPEAMRLHYELCLMFAQRKQFELSLDHFEQSTGPGSARRLRPALNLALQSAGMVDRVAASWIAVEELAEGETESVLDEGRR